MKPLNHPGRESVKEYYNKRKFSEVLVVSSQLINEQRREISLPGTFAFLNSQAILESHVPGCCNVVVMFQKPKQCGRATLNYAIQNEPLGYPDLKTEQEANRNDNGETG